MPSNPPQDFKHHAKLDPPFHFFMAPVFLVTFVTAIVHCFHYPSLMSGWLVVVALAALVSVFKIRVYALKVQDRLIKLEESIRLTALMPENKQPLMGSLTEKQFVALRFASDSEVSALAERAASQGLSPKDIKAAITSWRPDYFRV